MTVRAETNNVTYDCNGVTQKFAFSFQIFEKEDLKVTLIDSSGNPGQLTLDSDYTVSGSLVDGGTVTTTQIYDTGYQLKIELNLTIDQPIDLTYGGRYSSDAIEKMADRGAKVSQQINQSLSKYAVGPGASTEGHVVIFGDSTGKKIEDTGLTLSGVNTGDQDLSPLVPYMGASKDIDLGTHGLALAALQITTSPKDGYILTCDSNGAASWKAPWKASSPLTTKGDLWGFSNTDKRIPAGTDGEVLQADSSEALGLKWIDLMGQLVPYTGAQNNVDLGQHNIIAYNLSGNNTGDQDLSGLEPSLGNPSADDYILSSKADGTRSWKAPSSGSGDVSGPGSAADADVAFFDGTSGKLIKDSGLTLSGINTGDQDLSGLVPYTGANGDVSLGSHNITADNLSGTNTGDQDLSPLVTGPASATDANVVFFDGTTGKLIKDSGLTLSGTNTGDQDLSGLEPALGNPSADDYVLSSKTDGTRSWIAQSGGGSGDVSGPDSSTDADVVFFDGTTGKLIKDSGLTLAGTNTGDQDLSGLVPYSGATHNVDLGSYGITQASFILTASPTDGYVLTSDGNGVGSWKAAGGGSPWDDSCVLLYGLYNQTLPNDTSTKVTLDQSVFDVTNEGDTSNYRITVLNDGYYLIIGAVASTDDFGDNDLTCQIKVNGSEVYPHINVGSSGNLPGPQVSQLRHLNAGDYVELFAYQKTGGDITLEGNHNMFALRRVL